jgi:hypothetical protein
MRRLPALLLALLLSATICAQVIGPAAPSGSPVQLIDANGNAWTVLAGVVDSAPSAGSWAPVGYSQNVILLVDASNTFYQENNQCLWWSWTGSAWSPTGGLSSGPAGVAVPACTPSSAPSSAPAAYVPPVPPCLPKIQYPLAEADGSIPSGISTRYTNYTAWVCQFPNGYQTYANLFTPDATVLTAIWNYVKGMWTLSQAQADCLNTCVQPTSSEASYLQSLIAQYRPKAVVAFNGSSTTRSVYYLNSDGTLNTTAQGNVAVAAPCDETNQVPTGAALVAGAAAYFSVSGQSDQNGSPLPAGTYTICVVALPIGTN